MRPVVLLLLLAACEGPPALEALPPARQLGEEPAGVSQVARGLDCVAWTTSTLENTGRVWRWCRGEATALAVAQERAAPRDVVVGNDRIWWIEAGGLYQMANGGTESDAVHPTLESGEALGELTPLVAVGDQLIAWATLPDGSHALVRIQVSGDDSVVVARPQWDALVAAHGNQRFVAFTGLVGRRPEALTFTTQELETGRELPGAPVQVDPLRVVGGLWAGEEAFVWQDPGEPGLPPAVRARAYVGGSAHVVGELASGTGGLSLMPITDDAWLRAPRALIRLRPDGTSVRYSVPYDPVSITADVDGLLVTTTQAGDDRPTVVLLQPVPR